MLQCKPLEVRRSPTWLGLGVGGLRVGLLLLSEWGSARYAVGAIRRNRFRPQENHRLPHIIRSQSESVGSLEGRHKVVPSR